MNLRKTYRMSMWLSKNLTKFLW